MKFTGSTRTSITSSLTGMRPLAARLNRDLSQKRGMRTSARPDLAQALSMW